MNKTIKKGLFSLILAVLWALSFGIMAFAQDLVYVTNGAAQRYAPGSVLVINGKVTESGMPLSNVSVIVDIKDSSDKVVYYGQVKTETTGFFRTNFTVPKGVSGEMKVKLSTNEGEKVNAVYNLEGVASGGVKVQGTIPYGSLDEEKSMETRIPASTGKFGLVFDANVNYFNNKLAGDVGLPEILGLNTNNEDCFMLYEKTTSGYKKIGASVELSTDTGGPVSGITYFPGTAPLEQKNQRRNVIFITPDKPMKANTTYKVVIDGELSANNSSTLENDVEVFFTTEKSVPGSGDSGSGGYETTPPEDEVVEVETEVDGTSVTVTVDTPAIKDAMEKSIAKAAKTGTAAVITLNVDAPEDTKDVELKVSSAALLEVANSALEGLVVSTPVANINLDSASLQAIVGKDTAADVRISAKIVDSATLPERIQAKIQDRPVYDFSVTTGNNTISDFKGGKVIISMPYVLRAGENANAILAYYLDDYGNLKTVNSIYDETTGMVKMALSHLSKYVINYNKVTFDDVSDSAWYAESIGFVAARNIFNGVSVDRFEPNGPMTRAMFAQAIANLEGADIGNYHISPFDDVAKEAWYNPAVSWAAEKGIVNGMGGGKFAPNLKITREQMAVMLNNYINYKAITLVTVSDNSFVDEADISSWAKTAVDKMQSYGIVSGMGDNRFVPKDTANRAQVATIFANFVRAGFNQKI